jgi:type IV pilus assembly protein PilA
MKKIPSLITHSLTTVAMAIGAGSVRAEWSPLVADSPVSQSYVIQAQVIEGVKLARTVMAKVASVYAFSGRPIDSLETGSSGSYVSKVSVNNGRIDITYGGLADAAIANKTLSLTPYETLDQQVVWRCGNHLKPPGLETLGTSVGLPASYIPSTVDDQVSSAACAMVDAIPDGSGAYRGNVVRSQVVQSLRLADIGKQFVAKNATSATSLAAAATAFNAQNSGLGLSSQYVSSVLINPTTGEITVTFNVVVLGIPPSQNTLVLTPYIFDGFPIQLGSALASGIKGPVDWSCSSATSAIATSRGMPPLTMGTLMSIYAPPGCR